MNLVLLRHGHSEWNLANRFTGWTDIPLTASGLDEVQGLLSVASVSALPGRVSQSIELYHFFIGFSNHPPAKPGALEFVSRSKRLTGVANAARQFLGHLKVAGQLHSFIWPRR